MSPQGWGLVAIKGLFGCMEIIAMQIDPYKSKRKKGILVMIKKKKELVSLCLIMVLGACDQPLIHNHHFQTRCEMPHLATVFLFVWCLCESMKPMWQTGSKICSYFEGKVTLYTIFTLFNYSLRCRETWHACTAESVLCKQKGDWVVTWLLNLTVPSSLILSMHLLRKCCRLSCDCVLVLSLDFLHLLFIVATI